MSSLLAQTPARVVAGVHAAESVTLTVWPLVAGVNATYEDTRTWPAASGATVSGVLRQMRVDELAPAQQQEQATYHHLRVVGVVDAAIDDQLRLGARHFVITAIDDVAGLGALSILTLRERTGAD